MNAAEALRAVLAGETLAREQARTVFSSTLTGETDPIVLAGLLVALASRGETAEEITGAAEALRSAAVPFDHGSIDAIDTCGTGGDNLGAFNLSTTAAIVAAAAGARVIKHGNRSLSSRCGSADLLEAAGIPLELTQSQARSVFDAEGIVFLFAPAWHPAMRHAAPVRRALGVRTIFNFLGPLCNPGAVRRQLLGVSDAARVADYARVLADMEHERAYVVHGAGGADELTLGNGNHVVPVGRAPRQPFDALALGLSPAPVSALAGGDATANLALLGRVLAAEEGALLDAVLLNSAAAIVVAGLCEGAEEGVARAREAVTSGRAREKLASWVRTARRVKGAA
jgi:anthranilate phosphoribosyltransferase